ncbi:MAG TPA: CvpA family protein [Bryobacteraceae bacterium]|jgi:membrane protein required for colicin V production|nr:CvpA family protein [Bryobacteraceae bacterium]
MNWLDVVLALVLLGSVVTSFSTGLAREIVGMVSMLAALVLAIWFYGTAGSFLQPYVSSPGVANFCGFLMVFCGVLILGAILGRAMGRLMRVAGLSFVDRLLGAGFGLVRGLLISIALVLALLAFTPGKSPPNAVVDSRVAPYVIDAARVVAAVAPHELKDGFRKSYGQVKAIWGDALKKGIRGVPDAGKA